MESKKRKSPRTLDVHSPGERDKRVHSVVAEQTLWDGDADDKPSQQIVRADSPLGFTYFSTHADLARLQDTADDLRAILEEFRQIAGSRHRYGDSLRSQGRSRNPLQNWREAPERLNEAEKDELQRAIQEAHRRDLEELEGKGVEVESEEEEWDDDSLLDGSDGDGNEEASERLGGCGE